MSLVYPVLNRRFRKCEHDIILHDAPLTILIFIDKLLDEITCECNQKSLYKISLLEKCSLQNFTYIADDS